MKFEGSFKNKPLEIRGQRVEVGEHKLIKVEIDRLPTGTAIEIPIYVYNGIEDGPTILIQAGLHGDEVNGVETIRELLRGNYFKIKRGCIIVVPLLNVFGFLHFSREAFGKDVNRSFPGSKTGSLASRIAYFEMKEIVEHIDFGIDMHTGGAQRHNFPQVRYTPGSSAGKHLATIFNAPFQFSSNLIAKSFRKEAHKNGVPIIVYEAGEALRIDKLSVQIGINGVLNILEYFGMIDPRGALPKKHETVELIKNRWIRAKTAGMLGVVVENGQKVEKGQLLGYITDTYGASTLKIVAPTNGYIIAVNNFPMVSTGEAIFHFGF
ncbi:succinylglutamate desuccinylase/aspartoacylase family protein [Flavobacteriaceae bacterium F08102]|nr:succinylglutamate desuccinylase/aspartoacylase family protein [Flavobacteriaceae bacterium F08102]